MPKISNVVGRVSQTKRNRPDIAAQISEIEQSTGERFGDDPVSNFLLDNTRISQTVGIATENNRAKQLKVNQREQLASQKQELAQLKLQQRKRSSGRQSLLKSLPQRSSFGPSGTLA